MRRRTALAGTIALHGALLAAMLAIPEGGEPAPVAHEPSPVELVEVEVVRTRPPALPREAVHAGGGGGARHEPAPRVPVRVAQVHYAVARPDAPGRVSLGELSFGAGGGRGGGLGTGDGAGVGAGAGLGLGGAAAQSDAAIAHLAIPPPPVVVSKARPARLIYPANHREVEASEQFIARVDVDHEGFVVGAKLIQGFGGRRDEQAAALIFRFRYAPALDEDGRPIRSTFDQPFLVNR